MNTMTDSQFITTDHHDFHEENGFLPLTDEMDNSATPAQQNETGELLSECVTEEVVAESVDMEEDPEKNDAFPVPTDQPEEIALHSTLSQWIEADQKNPDFKTLCDTQDAPIFLRTNEAGIQLWTHWFNVSRQQLPNILKELSKCLGHKIPHSHSPSRQQPHAQNNAALMLSSLLLSNVVISQLINKGLVYLDPSRKLDAQLTELVGERVKEIEQQIQHSSTLELAEHLEQAWPFFSEVHNQGIFLRPYARTLLRLAAVRDQLLVGNTGAGSALRCARLQLAARLLLMTLPPRLNCAIGVQTSVFADCTAPGGFQFFGLNKNVIDHSRPFWEQVSDSARRTTFAYFRCVMESHKDNNEKGALGQIRQLDAQLVLQYRLPRTLDSIYQTFCRDEALPRYTQLRETLERYSAALEIRMDNSALPRDLVGRSLHLANIHDQTSVHSHLRLLIETEPSHIDAQALLNDSNTRLERLHAIHQEITKLSENPSVGNLLRIGKIAEEGRTEILSNQHWFEETLGKTKPYVKLWDDFYRAISELREQKRKKEEREKPVSKLPPVVEPVVVPTVVTTVMPESEAIQQLEEKLKTAHDDLDQLQTDYDQVNGQLREVRSEAHRLQKQNEALCAAGNSLRPDAPELNITLLRRVMHNRNSLTPIEILTYFDYLAGERVEILDSAWRGARGYPGSFNGSERLFDLLDKLLFDYLDAINSGSPDTQAKSIFGNTAYSARESDTTMNTTHMRNQRTFDYRGEKRIFERHLRIGNQPGYEGMRVYFDIIDKRIVIAYAGPHLEVSSSN